MPEVRNDDVTLFCEVEGAGEPVTVFAHGLTNNRNELAAFTPLLPGTKVRFDFRGHGRSSSPGDSTLMAWKSSATARSSSAADLPTPVNTMSRGVKPQRSATSTSPIELASTRLPSARSRRTMASVELALRA